jgi:hypothetical protein
LPNGPVGKVGVAAPPSRFGFAGPISYPGGKGGVAGRSKPSGEGRFTAVPSRNLFAR